MGKRTDMTFGQRLGYVRKKKGLLQKQLAELVGVKQQTICRWEKGSRRPNMSMIQKTLRALEVSEDWFQNDDNFISADTLQDIKLTKEQQELVAKNEWMIGYTYHHLFKFKNSEEYEYFYGYAAIGLCQAAQLYDNSKGRTFPSFAYDNIRWAILDARGKRNRNERLKTVSLDVSDDEKDGDEFGSIIPDPNDYFEQLEYKILAESVLQRVEHVLTANEKKTFKSWLNGKSTREIAIEQGIKSQSVFSKIAKAREKCIAFFNPDEMFAS
jgi:RNA polymerase sigma factor (sigma-70 family)